MGSSERRARLSTMKTAEREEAVRLRADCGKSVREIAAELGVARSSVSRWVRAIPLSSEQHEALRQRNPIYNGQRAGVRVIAERALARRREYQERGRARAASGDPVYIAGCMLYWAEGSKSRNTAQFTNSDPAMMRFFVDFVREFFFIPPESFRVSCNLFADHSDRVPEIERYWLRALDLTETSLLKSTVNRYSRASQQKRRNLLPYGTCRVAVNRTEVVQEIFGAIQEIGSFGRDDWLTR
jgi:transposase-like protein